MVSTLTHAQEEFDQTIELRFGPKVKIDIGQVFFLNNLVFAFVNLRPVSPRHVLISPRRQATHIKDVTVDELYEMFKTA